LATFAISIKKEAPTVKKICANFKGEDVTRSLSYRYKAGVRKVWKDGQYIIEVSMQGFGGYIVYASELDFKHD
jgi:hypothetical protein